MALHKQRMQSCGQKLWKFELSSREMLKPVNMLPDDKFSPYNPSVEDVRYNNRKTISRIRHSIANMGRKNLRNKLENAWATFHFQDASVDLRQRDNEFHGASYVDFKTGKLIHGFTGVVEKPRRGALGQVEAFQQCISRLYPESKQIKPENVWELFRQHRQEHLNTLGDDGLDDEMDRKETEAAPGFDDDDEIDLDLL